MFEYTEERCDTAALTLVYHLTPWDEPVLLGKAAAISQFQLRREKEAAPAFRFFRDWCIQNEVKLVSCRIPQSQLRECHFLEAHDFRFIELNYRPVIKGLEHFQEDPEIEISQASSSDAEEIVGFAAQIFETGRLHLDPQVGSEIGNRRYAAWAANAFHNPGQKVLKCVMDKKIMGFMVVESPAATSRFWSLMGLAPGMGGRGLGRRVWRSVLDFHLREGVSEVTTSISSHNIAVHNLYVSLGFRFPPPGIVLHWCPFGPLNDPS